MPMSMDVHDTDGGFSAEHVAGAQQADLETRAGMTP